MTEPTDNQLNPDVPISIGPPYQPGMIRLVVDVHVAEDSLWAELPQLPGCFATGTTPVELGTSLGEAVESYLLNGNPTTEPEPDPA